MTDPHPTQRIPQAIARLDLRAMRGRGCRVGVGPHPARGQRRQRRARERGRHVQRRQRGLAEGQVDGLMNGWAGE